MDCLPIVTYLINLHLVGQQLSFTGKLFIRMEMNYNSLKSPTYSYEYQFLNKKSIECILFTKNEIETQ